MKVCFQKDNKRHYLFSVMQLKPRKLSTRLQCPAHCKKIPEAAALSFERNAISLTAVLTFLLSVRLDDYPTTDKEIEVRDNSFYRCSCYLSSTVFNLT